VIKVRNSVGFMWFGFSRVWFWVLLHNFKCWCKSLETYSFIHIEHLCCASSRNYSEALPTPARLNKAVLRWEKMQVKRFY